MDLATWVDLDTHGWVVEPKTNADWDALAGEYGGNNTTPFTQVLRVVRDSGCRSVVVENRYVDLDYRSEYSAFWSHRFGATPAFARRLHFFTSVVKDERLHDLPADAGYLGYSVIRPLPSGAVGRTMIAAPPALDGATLTLTSDEVTLFGNRLTVDAAPFCQQDGDFLRCAHAAAWMCHYTAARRRLVARQQVARLVEVTPTMLSVERALPSKGLTLNQLQAIFEAFGQPALFYGLTKMPKVPGVDNPAPVPNTHPGKWDTRIFSVICRYLNSGFPVLIGTEDHAFVVVGWFLDGNEIRFVVNDDQQGPYQVVDFPFADVRGTWRAIMVPLPPSVLLSGETAEGRAHFILRALGSSPNADPLWAELATKLVTKVNGKAEVSLRTILCDASAYKRKLDSRNLDPDVMRLLRLARLPHYVWVVEAHDRAARRAGDPSVVAEVIFDSTTSDNDLSPPEESMLALLMPKFAIALPPDGGRSDAVSTGDHRWSSSLPSIPEFPAHLRVAS
jgi:hypothetical protein